MKPLRIGLLNFNSVINSELPALLVFGAVWDRGSRVMYDLLERAGEDFDGKIITGKVDYDYAPDIFSDYGIYEIPTMAFFEDGKMVMSQSGYNGTKDMKFFIEKFYGVLPY